MFEIVYRYDPAQPSNRRLPADAGEAMRRLAEGNEQFVALGDAEGGRRVVPIDLGDLGIGADGRPLEQNPFAVMIGCSDARVPTEMIFSRRCDELFVVRVAGNVLGPEQLGSVDYALAHLGESIKLVVVLGHSRCGAVTAAVDAFLTPVEYLELSSSHQLRTIVNTLFPSVRGAVRALSVRWGDDVTSRPGYRAALIECAVIMNAAVMASILDQGFATADGARRTVFGVYDLGSRRVQVPSGSSTAPLLEVPRGKAAFQQFAFDVAESAAIERLLAG
jgi:carbonic anhydrase